MVKKLVSGMATATLVASLLAPVAYADLEISGNGALSHNEINVETANVVVVEQENESLILTSAKSSASTGGNLANGNTGSGVTIDTGNATATTTVTIGGSSNTATVALPCGCATPPNELISGNGALSHNKIKYKTANVKLVGQENATLVGTRARSRARTGKNDANGNTGGTVDVLTGNAIDTTTVNVTGSTNSLLP
jgi:hypothetical protein